MPLQQHHAQRGSSPCIGGCKGHGIAVVDFGFARLRIPGVEQGEGVGGHGADLGAWAVHVDIDHVDMGFPGLKDWPGFAK